MKFVKTAMIGSLALGLVLGAMATASAREMTRFYHNGQPANAPAVVAAPNQQVTRVYHNGQPMDTAAVSTNTSMVQALNSVDNYYFNGAYNHHVPYGKGGRSVWAASNDAPTNHRFSLIQSRRYARDYLRSSYGGYSTSTILPSMSTLGYYSYGYGAY